MGQLLGINKLLFILTSGHTGLETSIEVMLSILFLGAKSWRQSRVPVRREKHLERQVHVLRRLHERGCRQHPARRK